MLVKVVGKCKLSIST